MIWNELKKRSKKQEAGEVRGKRRMIKVKL